MKKTLILFGLLMLMPLASAKIQSEDININRIRFGHIDLIDEQTDSYFYVYNDYPCSTVKDGHVTVTFMDDHTYGSTSNFDLAKKSGEGRHFRQIDAEPGEYLVRVSYYADGLRRVKHRYVFVE